jgi:Icc-related predicted phosphoesterase
MRVAVLTDIHGNLPALDAILDEIHAAAVDAIVLNGDIATGPMPAETLDRLAELGEKAIWGAWQRRSGAGRRLRRRT